MSKEAATVDRLAKRGFKGAFDPSGYGNSAMDNLTLEDLSGPALSSNPSNAVYQPAMALTADEQRNGSIDPVAAMELQREIAREEAGRGYSMSGGMGQEAQWPTDPAILAQYDRWADINAKNGPLAIEVTHGAEEEAGLLSRVAQGAGHAAVDLVTQPFAQLHDLGAIGYDIFDNTLLGDQSSPNYWSNIGRYEQFGEATTEGRILNLVGAVPVLNVGAMSYQGTTSLLNGDYGGFAEQVGALGVGFATGGVIGRYGNRTLQSPLTLDLQPGAVAYSGLPIKTQSLFANKAAADAWEVEVVNHVLPETQVNIQRQITIRSNGPSGLNVRLDALGRDLVTGSTKLSDMKASLTAPLTRNQTVVYPELEVYGGVVVGGGKAPYIGGTQIPPGVVDIIRKP